MAFCCLQSGVAYHSLGFEDENLGSSSAGGPLSTAQADWGIYTNFYLQSHANDRLPRSVVLSQEIKRNVFK